MKRIIILAALFHSVSANSQEIKSLCICELGRSIDPNLDSDWTTVVFEAKYCNLALNHQSKGRERGRFGDIETIKNINDPYFPKKINPANCRFVSEYIDPGPLLKRIKYLEDQLIKDRQQNQQLFRILKEQIDEVKDE